MYAKSIAIAALAAIPAVFAGSAVVHNKCECDIYLWSIANSADVTMETLTAGNASYSETYRTNPDGGGISIKIAKLDTQSTITQFEYTVSGETIFYDVSNINGYPFQAEGLALNPSVESCPSVTCPAGTDCSEAYNLPDDVRTKGCSSEADLVMVICPDASPAEDNSVAVAPSASSAAPVAATPASSSVEAAPTTTEAATPSVAPGTFVEEAATTTVPTWHSVNRRRGHSHGHRFARRNL